MAKYCYNINDYRLPKLEDNIPEGPGSNNIEHCLALAVEDAMNLGNFVSITYLCL